METLECKQSRAAHSVTQQRPDKIKNSVKNDRGILWNISIYLWNIQVYHTLFKFGNVYPNTLQHISCIFHRWTDMFCNIPINISWHGLRSCSFTGQWVNALPLAWPTLFIYWYSMHTNMFNSCIAGEQFRNNAML